MSSKTSKLRPLTDRQAAALGVICDAIDRLDRAPTIRELGDALEIVSTNGVNDHIIALIKKGYLDAGPDGESRSLRPLRYPDGTAFVGRAALLAQIAELQAQAAELQEQLEDAHASLAHVAAINDANVAAYERLVHELETERRESTEALAQCRAHCREHYHDARALRGQVSALQAELACGRLTLPASVAEALQAGDANPVLEALGLPGLREVA